MPWTAIDLKPGRRHFIAGLLATGLVPKPTWADAGSPAYLSAAARPDGTYVLCGLDAGLNVTFQLPLPARGHAAAAHPTRPQAVAFARRPGTFAVVIDCVTGQRQATLTAPVGRHFYGHGAFSLDGNLLFTTENDFEAGRGRIGVWDVASGYLRVDEWDSGGIGPHDIKRLPGTETLVVANGGIDTHPDTGRTKLNIPTMAPNLAYVQAGKVVEVATLQAKLNKNSIRHLAVGPEGRVAFGMQWQGEGTPVALVGVHTRGTPMSLMTAGVGQVREMDGYIGSIAFSADGRKVAATSPRGSVVQTFDAQTGALVQTARLPDVSGVAMRGDGFLVSTGQGLMSQIGQKAKVRSHLVWDNHLICI